MPTIVTRPANVTLAASTEGASRLQVLQPGAQNQKATGRPTNDAASRSTESASPAAGTKRAEKFSESGTLVAAEPVVADPDVDGRLDSPVLVPSPEPQPRAANPSATQVARAVERRSTNRP